MAPSTAQSRVFGENKTLRAGPPIDFAFKELKDLSDIVYAIPNSGHPKNVPIHDPNVPRAKGEEPKPIIIPPMAAGLKGVPYNSIAFRICNNLLSNLKGLEAAIEYTLDDPSAMQWLDLSYNHLTTIESVILKYPNIQMLYMHGNRISDIKEVMKLRALPHLQKLTLHGNPIAEKPGYRATVAAMLPGLKNLDFGAITKIDRDVVKTFFAKRYEEHPPEAKD